MIAFLRRLATPRSLFLNLLILAILAVLIHVIVLPGYRNVASGLVPFNMQYPLSREMVAFERGAFGPGVGALYLRFTTLDCVFALVYAWFTILLWCWLGAKVPNTAADKALSYGLLALPVLGFGLGLGESMLFMKLILAGARDPQHDLTTTVLAVHRAKYVVDTLTYAFTAAYIVTATLGQFMGRWRRV